jgi:hypothetical protein
MSRPMQNSLAHTIDPQRHTTTPDAHPKNQTVNPLQPLHPPCGQGFLHPLSPLYPATHLAVLHCPCLAQARVLPPLQANYTPGRTPFPHCNNVDVDVSMRARRRPRACDIYVTFSSESEIISSSTSKSATLDASCSISRHFRGPPAACMCCSCCGIMCGAGRCVWRRRAQ